MGPQELRRLTLFDSLSDAQLAELVEVSTERRAEPQEDVWHEGQPADRWWVLLEGSVTLLKRVGKEESPVGKMTTPGQWAGGFGAWDPNGICFATGRAAERTRLLEVPAAELARLGSEWFAFGVHFIRGLVDTVRRVESTARQREALVALGTLAAGLAHEINNPAAAATRAVDSLATTSASSVAATARLAAHGISTDQFASLEASRRALVPLGPGADPLAAADREDELADWLVDHDVAEGWLLAPSLAASGITTAWCDEVADIVGPAAAGAAIEWVGHSLTMDALLGEVKDATGRISALVGAVRSYSQLDRAAVQLIDVTEGLESTLAMLAYKLKSVTVERDFSSDVPRIGAIPGELNQVWTNVIDNAVDAMDGVGTLRLSTRLDDLGGVVVEIEDSGPGMPADVQARAFEPFYTTKDVGKGTGLGLDISRRIVVERHSGDIAIESRPGRTVMRVTLPIGGQLPGEQDSTTGR
ncbi:ATP-binding protein [Nocardioides xinjiangensis]|uniref:ATP-binding protein n=1 Tax=Nocardioides xinjiangensis TaxID=2817376 RepID=UPI001B316213|nr:ATP-binding protein [Nocardioides sp. SYSU D00778]